MKRLLISLTVIVLLIAPQFAFGSDVDDLKAADQKLTQAWNSLDAETAASMFSQGAVAYSAEGAFPLVAPMASTQAERADYMKAYLENVEYISIYPYNPQYRVFGSTGIAWGYYSISSKEKGQPRRIQYIRYTSTWIKSDGKWLLLLSHESTIPQGD